MSDATELVEEPIDTSHTMRGEIRRTSDQVRARRAATSRLMMVLCCAALAAAAVPLVALIYQF